MKQNKPITWTRFIKTMSISVICSVFILSCNSNSGGSDTTTTTDPVVQPPCPAGKLYVCHLTKTHYNDLKAAAGPGAPSHIVVQFTYNGGATPYSLIAYAARPGNRRYQIPGGGPGSHPPTSRPLTAVSQWAGPYPASFVMGDQQIDIALIDALVAPLPAGADYILTFTPEINGINVRFKICVINPVHCPAAGVYTNPSPPANVEP